jgi:type IV pilus assembly protein PilC
MPKKLAKIKEKDGKAVVKRPPFFNMGLEEQKSFFLENLSTLLDSGMDILMAVTSIKEDVKSKKMKKILGEIEFDIESGLSLHQALEKTGVFGFHIISLVNIGEQSGRLSENLKVIVDHDRKNKSFKSKLKSAMIYPVLVLSFTIVIGIIISWFILPRLSVIFSQLKLELPLTTRVLLAVGDFLGRYGLIAIPIFVFLTFCFFYFIFFFSKTKNIGQIIIFNTPKINNIIRNIELSRMGYVLGSLLDAGMPIVNALNSLGGIANFHQYKKFYLHLEDSIEEGNSFQKSFDDYKKIKKLIPYSFRQMIVAGERSGNLSKVLRRMGQVFEEKTENITKNLATILEPIFLVIVWLGVVFVSLAVISPIYNLVGGLNNQVGTVNTSSNRDIVRSAVILKDTTSTTTKEIQDIVKKMPKIKVIEDISFLNIRLGDSFNYNIIDKANPGQIYEYVQKIDNWYEVILDDGKTGWVYGEYVNILKN